MDGKLNCWQVMKCGREPGGTTVRDLGICPATIEKRLEGVHGGEKAGRACWVVAGTFCTGKVEGTFAQKYSTCEVCDFYRRVKAEESPRFILSPVLLKMLNGT